LYSSAFTQLTIRCKEECTSWARLLHETKTKRTFLHEQIEKKRRLDQDPDMSTAEGWMRDALELADEVLEAGEGELVGMADFGDVEFMVCPLCSHFPSLYATRQDVLFCFQS